MLQETAHKITNSTRLPKVIFSNAPALTPRLKAAVSVANVKRLVSGMIARAFSTKVMIGCSPMAFEAIPKGTKISSTLSHYRVAI